MSGIGSGIQGLRLTFSDRDVLNQVIQKSELLIKERKLGTQGNLVLLLVHDLLLNKSGIVANSGPFKDAVLRHKTRLNAEWIKAKIKMKAKDNSELAKVDSTFIPRWARINTLKSSKEDMLRALSSFQIVRSLEKLKMQCIYIDEHIENLLAFHPQQVLTNHKHYLDGSLIFQNKASCIPAAVCNPAPGSSVIDACAAPGNKTSHLAAILNNSGQLFAFERDNKRVLVLREMLQKADASVDVTHGDFTRADPYDARFANVKHLLLDPSCSGSGIVNRLDYLTAKESSTTSEAMENDASKEVDQDRLDSLASFQLALLLHAMKFPAAEKIVYSTCSIHAIENERVVMEALRKSPEWTIASRADTLPSWPTRGIAAECNGDKRIAEGLIRADPGALGTIGFFVASFVKKDSLTKKRSTEDALFLQDEDSEDDTGADSDNQDNSAASKNKKKKRKRTNNKKKKKKKNTDLTTAASASIEAPRRSTT